MNNVIYEDNHLLIVDKKINVPVQLDESNDLDLQTILKEYLKKKYNKPGNVYLGIIHRLDRPVGGLMVFAKTSKCAERMSQMIKDKLFKKEYYAVIEGNPKSKETLIDKITKNEETHASYISDNGKEAILDYELIDTKCNLSLVRIDLKTGRHHQIRVQFSSRNMPLWGDQKYNKNANKNEQIALFAKKIEFIHPVTREKMSFELELPNSYPFALFK